MSKTLAGRRDAAGGGATKIHWAKRFKPYTLVTPSRRSCRPVIVILPYLVSGRVGWHESDLAGLRIGNAGWTGNAGSNLVETKSSGLFENYASPLLKIIPSARRGQTLGPRPATPFSPLESYKSDVRSGGPSGRRSRVRTPPGKAISIICLFPGGNYSVLFFTMKIITPRLGGGVGLHGINL